MVRYGYFAPLSLSNLRHIKNKPKSARHKRRVYFIWQPARSGIMLLEDRDQRSRLYGYLFRATRRQ